MIDELPRAALLACLVVAGCEYSYKKPGSDAPPEAAAPIPPKAEDLAAVRAEALAQIDKVFWPFGRKELVVTDASFVDPCIVDIIQHSFGYDGGIPPGGELRTNLAEHTAICWRNKLDSQEGYKSIAPLVKNRYEHPVITREGDKVTIDMGVVPGTVSKFRGAWKTHDSGLVDAYYDLKTPEAVRILKLGIAKEPSAGRYEAIVDVGTGSNSNEAIRKYLYDRKADLIQVTTPWHHGKNVFQSESLHGDVGSVKSLARDDLKGVTFPLP